MRIDPSSLISAQAARWPAQPRPAPQKEAEASFESLTFRNTPEAGKPVASTNPAPTRRLGANLDIKV